MNLWRTVVYVLIVLVVSAGLFFVGKNFVKRPIGTTPSQLAELGLGEQGNSLITVVRPSSGQIISSPLSVMLTTSDLSGTAQVQLKDQSAKIISQATVDFSLLTRSDRFTAELTFPAQTGNGWLEVIPSVDPSQGFRLPVKFSP